MADVDGAVEGVARGSESCSAASIAATMRTSTPCSRSSMTPRIACSMALERGGAPGVLGDRGEQCLRALVGAGLLLQAFGSPAARPSSTSFGTTTISCRCT